MKRQVEAAEIVNAEIEFVSLVKRGANKRKFAILKADELPNTPKTLGEKLTGLIKQPQAASVTGIICPTELKAYTEALAKDAGLRVDDTQEFEGLTIFKQDGFDLDKDVSVLALDENVLVTLDRVVKGLSTFQGSTDFNENLAAGSFYPGVQAAMQSLGETIFNSMIEAKNPGDASDTVSKALDAFNAHVKSLVANLPSTVFKMDAAGLKAKQEHDMNLAKQLAKGPQISETVPGDLAALDEVKKSEAPAKVEPEAAPKAEAAPAETVAKEEQPTVEPVKPEAKVESESTPADPMAVLAKSLEVLAASLGEVKTFMQKQSERLDAVEAKAKEAVAKAAAPVVVNNAIRSEQLATPRGHKPVQKHDASADESVWNGLMSQFDGLSR